MVRRLGLGKNNHLTYASLALNPRYVQKDISKLSPFVSWPGIMINPQWLKVPMSSTNIYDSKDIWAVEVFCNWIMKQINNNDNKNNPSYLEV